MTHRRITAMKPRREVEGMGRLPVTPKSAPTPALTAGCPLRKSPSFKGPEVLRSLCCNSGVFSPVVGEV